MPSHRLPIANCSEVAIRIARAAAELGVPSPAVCSADEAASPHVRRANLNVALGGDGVARTVETWWAQDD